MLINQRRHRDRDPLLGRTRAPAGSLSAAACPEPRLSGHHILIAIGVGGAGVDRIGQDVVRHGARPLRPSRPGEPRPGVQPCDAPADGVSAHEPFVDLTHHVGLCRVDDQPRRHGAGPRLVAVAVGGLGAEDMPVARLLQLATPEPLRQHRTLILGDGPLDLQQKLVVGIIGNGMVQEHYLTTRAAELLQQKDLIGILARQPVWTEHHHDVDGGITDGIPQAVQPRPVQPGAAVALVAAHVRVGQGMTLSCDPGLQGGELAVDGLLALLALGRDPAVEGNAHGSSPGIAGATRHRRGRRQGRTDRQPVGGIRGEQGSVRHVWTASSLQGESMQVTTGRVLPCVRPVCAAHGRWP